jgi:hypothetical protein
MMMFSIVRKMIKLPLPLLVLPSDAMWPNPSDPTRSQESGEILGLAAQYLLT